MWKCAKLLQNYELTSEKQEIGHIKLVLSVLTKITSTSYTRKTN